MLEQQHNSNITSEENIIYFTLDPMESFNEHEYLELAKRTLANYQSHVNQVPNDELSRLEVFSKPATAVIIGAGTVGLEAIVYASRILPLHSAIIILQNDIKEQKKLEQLLKDTVNVIENFNIIISPPMDLGQIDKISDFLDKNKKHLSHAQLFIHAADKARRFIPDVLNYREVICQIIRRGSIQAVEEKIEEYADSNIPYVRILFSSICAMNRNEYRIPNIGPYQLGKIVGDELFKSMQVRKNSYSFILYSGGMYTMGETLTRKAEYQLVKSMNRFNNISEKEYTEKWVNAGTHVDSMDSSGLMFKNIWEALQNKKLMPGKIYSIYGSSIPKSLGHKLNVIQEWEPAPYWFDPLEA